jgi:hypothetical protein
VLRLGTVQRESCALVPDMSACFDQSDVVELSRAALADSRKRLDSIPEGRCALFYEEARSLEVELLTIYRAVAICVRKEDKLDRIQQWWSTMKGVCDHFATRLSEVQSRHPSCGANTFYDRVLDLRNRCQRLAEMHQ